MSPQTVPAGQPRLEPMDSPVVVDTETEAETPAPTILALWNGQSDGDGRRGKD